MAKPEPKDVAAKQDQVSIEDVRHVLIDEYQEHYANIATVGFSPWDIQINFGELRAGGVRGNPPEIIDKVCVTLAPEHAVRLLRLVSEKLRQRRERYGPVNEPSVETEIASETQTEGKTLPSETKSDPT